MDIDLVRFEKSKELLAMKGNVNGSDIQILADTCANTSFLPAKVCKELGIEIDNSKICRIIGASGIGEMLGRTKDILITLARGCSIKDNFSVISDYPHREIVLGRNCLKKYNYDIHESRDHIALTCAGKNFFIPIVPDENRPKKIEVQKSIN